ncbi:MULTISPECIES: hypothetical protein [Ensifer]|jgi:hypothetical protein|uniref:hypothetical protein n=1 Tax=Ensifer TaxID=106591 RepID=UPI000D8FBBFF|nr:MULTISPECIES: hypothetical protein [Ensifer]MBD9560126.1 hypothetical protein [Ensifer sp. ENS03]MCY1745354.1 hypothetical protein [Ensifer sp. SL37]UTV41008.1 hypothetical protein MYG64_27865 [Ensifer adhaerens]
MTENDRRQMNASEIPAFVVDVIEAGCNICAVGHESYVLGDIDEQHAAIEELERIREKYGDRDPLKLEIVAYLWSIGRFINVAPAGTSYKAPVQASLLNLE